MSNRSQLWLILCLQVATLASCGRRETEGGGTIVFNRLAHAGSPYLREHADNPVDWYEWGPEALQKAKEENKPLIISIGYSSCHWCHVMEEESFMDSAVARFMNENFIAIKVDREERPDIDQIYLNAAQIVSGHAGWPLNAFALPDGKPFYAATYFPKQQWLSLLQQVSNAFHEDKSAVIKQAEALTEGVKGYDLITDPANANSVLSREKYAKIIDGWSPGIDYTHGGIRGAPKFPMPVNWEFALQYHFVTKNSKALRMATTALDHMADGGIYDHLGGGFFRYSTDDAWRIPHFEKMLYDNAQLVSLYAHAWQVTRDSVYFSVIMETLGFIQREMTSADGGFYASVNADSEGEEGKYYAWTKAEVKEILGDPGTDLFALYYHLTDSGNWEGKKNILYTGNNIDAFAGNDKIRGDEWQKVLREGRQKLLAARSKRIRPSTDEKVLTSWNALMLKAYLDAFVATTDKNYFDAALTSARFMEARMMNRDGALWRTYHKGRAGTAAFLDDYANLARAFIQLYQVTFDVHWLEQARALADFAVEHFRDSTTGMFYYTSDLSEKLIARKMELADNVMPSSNSVMAEVLFMLGEYYQLARYTQMSMEMIDQISRNRLGTDPINYANWERLLGFFVYQPFEVAVVGSLAVEKSLEIQKNFNPLALYLGGDKKSLPLLENKYVEGKTIIYVCRNRVCKLPVEEVEKALGQLKGEL